MLHYLHQIVGAILLDEVPDSHVGLGVLEIEFVLLRSGVPAGLAFQTGTEAAITHSSWLPEFNADLFYEYLIAKHHVPGWGTFGGHLTYLFLGEHEGRDAQNNPTGTFRSYDLATGLSYGAKLSERFALGTSLRFIYSNLAPGQTVGAQETKAAG